MDLIRSTAPAALLELATVKNHLRVEHTDDDTLITSLIAVAEQELDGRDGYLKRAIATQTWDWQFENFPSCAEIILPFPPLQSVTHVKYYDADNVQQTFSSANYAVYANTYRGYLRLAIDAAWPAVYDRDDAVSIRFVCGYGSPAAVPAPIKQAAMLLVGQMYTERGDSDGKTPMTGGQMLANSAARRLLARYRLHQWRA